MRAGGARPRRGTRSSDVAADFVNHDSRMLAELAELWGPDVPVERNAAYLAKEREQYAAIEAALRSRAGARGGAAAGGEPAAKPGGRAATAGTCSRARAHLMRRGIVVALQHPPD